MEKIIEIKDLHKSFGANKAVDGISFSVRKGELFAFLGVNGAGKSTTINILVGVLRKDSGECLVDGIPVENIERILPEVGIVFQASVLDKRLSVLDNLRYRAALYGMDRKAFQERLSFFEAHLELKSLYRKPLGSLSGGQKRKVDIARALLHRPKVLILDEPTTGLDPQTRKDVWDLVTLLRRKESLTVILTTHYMEEASRADYVVIIDKGRIVTEGTPIFLKERYAHDYLRIYRYDESLKKDLEASGLSYSIRKDGLEVRFRHTDDAKAFLVDHEKQIHDLEIVKGTMDDVFLNVTGKELKNQ